MDLVNSAHEGKLEKGHSKTKKLTIFNFKSHCLLNFDLFPDSTIYTCAYSPQPLPPHTHFGTTMVPQEIISNCMVFSMY